MTLVVPPLPAGIAPADRLDDAEIADELAVLRDWGRRYYSASFQQHDGSTVSDYLMRVSALARVQNQRRRAADWEARRQREQKEKADYEARAQVGAPRRDSGGALIYPVSCAEHGHLGTVRRAYVRSRKWRFTRADNGSSGAEYGALKAAAGALVWIGDLAAAAAGRQRQQDAARTAVPEGWEYGDWDDLTAFDVIRVPRYGKAEDGTLYPRGWGEAVEVRGLNRLDSGLLVVSLAQLDGSYADPLFVSHQDMKDVGFLWPVGRVRPQPQPHREKLRVRLADIADDVATVRRRLGDTDRIQRLADLIARLERSHTPDLFADLRQIEAETAFLRAQVSDTNQPYEVHRTKSWAVAAHLKTQHAIQAFATDPDFAWAVAAAN
ncbi:hypothetical protein ABZ502_32675 [Streptomyces abikoensis]|uniref:hypothetical protein n=1 Tax=Streptomyces abikoensis TaxID=97398 RepID=UPI0033C3B09B